MTEDDAALLERSDAIAGDQSADGQASVTATAQSCPQTKVTVGLFFDGTWNNAFNVADFRDEDGSAFDDASYSGSYTNVRRLWDLHFDPSNNVPNDCGDADLAYERRYIEGIGTITGRGDTTYGGAAAGGEAGIAAQLARGTRALEEAVSQYGSFEDLRELTVNCFGFSRGAATARVFCNMLADSQIPNLKIGFLGLFDSVGSIGIPGNNVQREAPDEVAMFYCSTIGMIDRNCRYYEAGPVYDLNIRGTTAETVFQIVAGDEFRIMYPSASILPSHGTEVWMPGAHGDIGGAEADEMVTETYMDLPGFLVRRGWFDEARREIARPATQGRGAQPAIYRTLKDVQPNIGTASLHAMHFHAQRAQVPLKPLAQLDPTYHKPMSPLLSTAASIMEAGASVTSDISRQIRARYVHKSFGGLTANTRLLFTERRRYPNG